MSNGNGAALLGGLLLGGIAVGAAMNSDKRHHHNRHAHNHHHNHHGHRYPAQQRRAMANNAPIFCICGAKMAQGVIQQGAPKCNNLNCQKLLTGSVCYYCPNGGNVQQHKNGFFYCQPCALRSRKNGVVQAKTVVQQPPSAACAPVVQQHQRSQSAHAYPAQRTTAANTNKPHVVRQGFMSKKGNWLNTAYKKRWFKLWSNKKMAYFTEPNASYTKGYADFTKIKTMQKKGNHGMEVVTAEREWSFLCQSTADRDDWFRVIQSVCLGVQPQIAQPVRQPVQYAQPQPQLAQGVYPQLPSQGQPQPQVPYAQPYVPQAQAQAQTVAPSAPGAYNNNNNAAPASSALEPGMDGYNAGDMYSANAPPPAYASAAPSAPPQYEVAPSAPPMDNQNEGAYTGGQ